MKIKLSKPTSPGRRFRMDLTPIGGLTKSSEKSLLSSQHSKAGRSKGRISMRHRGGGVKKHYRIIDFKRDKIGIEAVVKAIEYDPNRSPNIALLFYVDGEKRYILAPVDLKVGDRVVSGDRTPMNAGNTMRLKNISLGTVVHNIELIPGHGGQLVRGAGTAATLTSKEGAYVQLKMPSGERRLVQAECFATLGQLSQPDLKNMKLGKAGRSRLMGRRPKVRGVAMFPAAHPHGGGEARAGIGMSSPKTPWGKPTLGYKTRKRKHTTKYIVKDRRKK